MAETAPQAENVLVTRDGDCAVVTLNRPDKLNPLDRVTIATLLDVVTGLEADRSLRCVIVTGAGRAFSAGGDLDGYLSLYRDAQAFRVFLDSFYRLLAAIERSEKIYIAAINGACVAGGLELLLSCDAVLAADSAVIGDGHLNFGQLPGAGGSQRLPRAIGALRAKHLMLTGRMIDAAEAERIGLVGEVVPAADLLGRAQAFARDLSTKSPAGLRGAKYLVNQGLGGTLESGLQLEIAYVHNYATTEPDATEGLVAFKEKRQPVYGGA
jgi:enoyl-CoA hydratase